MKNRPEHDAPAGPFVATVRKLSRRHFLRDTGITLSLPLLNSMMRVFAGPPMSTPAVTAGPVPGNPPRRMFAICNNLGLLPDPFFPKETGRGYALSSYLGHLKEHREDLTVFSGVAHPDVDGGHPADNCFLTAAPHPGRGGFRKTISLDQFIAERIGHLTRFPSLNLSVNVEQGMRSLAWTGSGVLIPCEEKSADVFRHLFIQGSAAETENQMRKLELGLSILDSVADQAKTLQRACRHARPRSTGAVFHERSRVGEADADVPRMGAETPTHRFGQRAARS